MKNKLIFIMLICVVGLWHTGCKTVGSVKSFSQLTAEKVALEKQIEDIDQKLKMLNAEIAKHQANHKRMQDLLIEARKKGTVPDLGRLKQYATATGQRTKEYHQAQPWLKKLIDEFEGDKVYNAKQAAGLATKTAFIGINRASYVQEMIRTKDFIKILEREKERLQEDRNKAVNELESINEALNKTPPTSGTEGNGDGGGGY